MPRELWRHAEAVKVPNVVGMHIADANRVAGAAGLKLAQPDPDGPPLGALTWPDDYWVTAQTPAPGATVWRYDSLVVWWSDDHGSGVREPRRSPPPPTRGAAGLHEP